ncbi:MAG: hypothetical protein RL235_881 [Chlamydiota bacterium]|jgi:hypothetical protein
MLIVLAGGGLTWKVSQIIDSRRFDEQVKRLYIRLATCHLLALSEQADWVCTFVRHKDKWIVTSESPDRKKALPFSSIDLGGIEVEWNKKTVNRLEIDCTATGQLLPKGELCLKGRSKIVCWSLPEEFALEEGDKKGPLHPSVK